MAAIINLSIKVSELKKMDQSKVIIGKKDNYIHITVKINDESSQYGKNASVMIKQSDEERSRKDKPHYLGDGSVVWTNNIINRGEKPLEGASNNNASAPFETTNDILSANDDLPF